MLKRTSSSFDCTWSIADCTPAICCKTCATLTFELESLLSKTWETVLEHSPREAQDLFEAAPPFYLLSKGGKSLKSVILVRKIHNTMQDPWCFALNWLNWLPWIEIEWLNRHWIEIELNWITIELILNWNWIEIDLKLNWNWFEVKLKLNFIEWKLVWNWIDIQLKLDRHSVEIGLTFSGP